MAVVIRADGKEKVTGVGRYAADLTLTGLLHGRFKYADIAHARIRRLDTSKARALPGVFAVITAGQRAGRPLRPLRQGPDAVREGRRPLGGRGRRRRRGRDAGDREAGRRPDRGRLRAAAGRPRSRDGARARRPDRPRRTGAGTRSTNASSAAATRRRTSSIVKGDAAAALASADVVVKGRFVADGSQAAPIEPRAIVAEWHGDRVQIWSSTQVPFAARALVSETLQLAENTVRITVPHLGGGFGAKCEGHFEPQVAALAKAAGRPVKADLLAPRGVPGARPSPRGHGHRARDRRHARRHGRGPTWPADSPRTAPTAPTSRSSRRWRCNSWPARTGSRTSTSSATASTRTPSRPARCVRRGRRRPPGRSSSTSTSLRRRSGMDPVELRRKNLLRDGDEAPLGQYMDDDPCDRDARARRRADRLRQAAAGRRGDRHRLRLVAVVPDGVGRVPQDQRRRVADDHHRCPGMRHRRGHDAADPGRRDPGAAARKLLARLPGHRDRAVGRRCGWLADAVQQRPGHRRTPRRRSATAS